MRLSAEQLGEFKASGYLVLDAAGAIGEAQLAAWRGQLWGSFGVEESDPGSWAERRPLEGATVSPRLHELPAIQALAAQLSDGAFRVISPDDRPVCVFPHEDRPLDPHLDGYSQRGWAGGFMLGMTCYVTDVEEQGGAFTLWPRSHAAVHRYFRDEPQRLDGS